jgi:hypothetical protein
MEPALYCLLYGYIALDTEIRSFHVFDSKIGPTITLFDVGKGMGAGSLVAALEGVGNCI